MKNYPFQSQSKRSLSIKTLSFLLTLFLLSSCSKGGGSGGGNDSQNASANVVNENPASNMQNYLLIGAKGRSDTGSVFKCSLDGTDCVEFLGGKIGLPSSPELKLQNDDSFGSSISANDKYIFIGSNYKNGFDQNNKPAAKNPNGAIYKCDLSGKNCTIIATDSLKLITNDNFGTSLFATKDAIYTGATGRDGGTPSQSNIFDIGAIFKCNSEGTNCAEFIAGKNTTSSIKKDLKGNDHLGTAIYISNSNIYIGAKDKYNFNGAVFKCDLSGQNCIQFDTAPLKLITNDNFGVSLSGNENNIFIGSIGRDSGQTNVPELYDTGSVFQCDLNGKNCLELLGGQNQTSRKALGIAVNDNFGSSIAVIGDSIYIGAMNRKDVSGKRTGSVFKCKIDGTNCNELIGGKSINLNSSNTLGLKEGDLFGSSITIVTLPKTETGFILRDIYKTIAKSSYSLFNSNVTPVFSAQISTACDSSEVTNQELNPDSKILKLAKDKNCKISITSLKLDKEELRPTEPITALQFSVDNDKKTSALDKAVLYTSTSGAKYYLNITSNNPGTFVIGVTDLEKRFNASNFNFVSFDLIYDGKTNAPSVLDKTNYFKDKVPASHSIGYVLPNSKEDKAHTITWGGDTGKNPPTFSINIHNLTDSSTNQITLVGNSIPGNCPTYTNWPLTTAVGIACGPEASGNFSKGFTVKFDPALNASLAPGKYVGGFHLQAIDWHDPNIFQNIVIMLDITIPKKP
jgi:hypothetical protein